MQMVKGVTNTQDITTTHHLVMTLVIAAGSQARGTPIRTTIAIGGGEITKAMVRMRANGITPGIEAMTTAETT